MSTGYGREGIRQVCETLLGARHVPELFCSGSALLEALYQVFDLYLLEEDRATAKGNRKFSDVWFSIYACGHEYMQIWFDALIQNARSVVWTYDR